MERYILSFDQSTSTTKRCSSTKMDAWWPEVTGHIDRLSMTEDGVEHDGEEIISNLYAATASL